jgi:hypothetical protein
VSRIVTVLHRRRTKVWALGTATAAQMNTSITNNMGADGFTWANAPSITDQFGNIITITEDNSQNHRFTFSNNGGATWTDSTLNEGFLTRGAMWLDAAHNLLHVLWVATQANGGAIYRRYAITYSSQSITDIASDSTIGTRTNVVLDDGTALVQIEHPVLIGLPDIGGTYGALLAVWGVGTASAGEVRAAMLVMGATATAGQTLANWVAPVTSSSTTLGANSTPATGSYSALATATVSSGNVPYLGVARGANKNLFIVYFDNTGYRWLRATWNSGASNWSSGLTATTLIYNRTRAGSDTGYTLKAQLISAPSEDASGNMIVGLASWRDNANGDTWGFARIDPAGTLTTVDVHSWAGSSAGGSPSLYPTGDVAYEPLHGLILATYITQTQVFAQLYNPATLAVQGSATALLTRVFDIPLILRSAVGTKVGIIGRDAVNTPTPPYHGYWITLTEV